MGYVDEATIKNTVENILTDSPLGEVAKSVASVLEELGLAASVAAELMAILAAKYGIATVDELKPYLTEEAAKAARAQADILEAAKLAESK